MRIQVDVPYSYKGDIYRFTLEFAHWMQSELEKRVAETEAFKRDHGNDWTLFFRWDCGRRIKKPKLAGPWIDRKYREKRWLIEMPCFRYTSPEPKAYVPVLKQFLEHLVLVLTREQIDASELKRTTGSLLKRFVSRPTMIEYHPHPYTFGTPDNPYGLKKRPAAPITPKVRAKSRAKLVGRKLPNWPISKNIDKRVEEAGGAWENKRFDPILLTIISGTSYRGRDIPLAWQIEFEPDDEQFKAANEKLLDAGIEPDGEGWSSVIQERFKNRFPKLAGELHDDSESSTCVLWVESESGCKALAELVWSMLFKT